MLSAQRDSLSRADRARRRTASLSISSRGGEVVREPDSCSTSCAAQLAREIAIHTDEHPNVIALRDRIARLAESPKRPLRERRRILDDERREIARLREQRAQVDAELAAARINASTGSRSSRSSSRRCSRRRRCCARTTPRRCARWSRRSSRRTSNRRSRADRCRSSTAPCRRRRRSCRARWCCCVGLGVERGARDRHGPAARAGRSRRDRPRVRSRSSATSRARHGSRLRMALRASSTR